MRKDTVFTQEQAAEIAGIFFDKQDVAPLPTWSQRLSSLFGAKADVTTQNRYPSVAEACAIMRTRGYSKHEAWQAQAALKTIMPELFRNVVGFIALEQGRLLINDVRWSNQFYLGVKGFSPKLDLSDYPQYTSDMKLMFGSYLQWAFRPKSQPQAASKPAAPAAT